LSVLSKIQSGILEGYELISEVEVNANTTTVTFSNLNGDEDVEYILLVSFKNASTVDECAYYFCPNGLTTNLSSQRIHVDGSAVSAARYSYAFFLTNVELNGGTGFAVVHYYAKSGVQRRHVSLTSMRDTTTLIRAASFAGLWNETETVITSLEIKANQTNGIGAGSKLFLFRKATVEEKLSKGFEKVAEIELVSDVAYVDIDGLDGDVDEVYDFLAYIINKYTDANAFELEPNAMGVNLAFQYVWANGSTVGSNRVDGGRAAFAEAEGVDDTCFSRVIFYAKSGIRRRYVAHCSGYLTIRGFLYSGIWDDTTTKITSMRVISYWSGNYIGAGSKIILYKLRK